MSEVRLQRFRLLYPTLHTIFEVDENRYKTLTSPASYNKHLKLLFITRDKLFALHLR